MTSWRTVKAPTNTDMRMQETLYFKVNVLEVRKKSNMKKVTQKYVNRYKGRKRSLWYESWSTFCVAKSAKDRRQALRVRVWAANFVRVWQIEAFLTVLWFTSTSGCNKEISKRFYEALSPPEKWNSWLSETLTSSLWSNNCSYTIKGLIEFILINYWTR